METLNVKKTGASKYGHYLLLDDGSFTDTTEQVSGFLQGKCPATVEVTGQEEKNGRQTVTKVKVLSSTPQTANTFAKARESKSIEMLTSYAKDLYSIAFQHALEHNTDFDSIGTAKQCAKVVTTIRQQIESPEEETEETI